MIKLLGVLIELASMNKKETYLYEIYLALVREQFTAHEKLSKGSLGFWGVRRAESRTKDLGKFLERLFEEKMRSGAEDPFQVISDDLDFIEIDYKVWGDVRRAEINFIRDAIGIFRHPN